MFLAVLGALLHPLLFLACGALWFILRRFQMTTKRIFVSVILPVYLAVTIGAILRYLLKMGSMSS